MAEEKNVEKTTKKTAPKKEAEKEVKVEKRFCPNCGKELTGDEVCDCKKEEPINGVNTEALANFGKEFLDTNVKMYKKPESTLEEEVKNSTLKKTLIVLGVIAITYGLYFTGIFKALFGMIFGLIAMISGESIGSVDFTKFIELPYFKIFIYGALIYYAVAFLPVLASLAVAKINKSTEFNFQKSTSLYVTSMIPTILSNVVLAIIFLLNVSFLTKLGLIAAIIISVICFVNYMIGFIKLANIKKDKKAYSVAGVVAIWLVLSYIVARIIVGPMMTDIMKDFKIGGSSIGGNGLFEEDYNEDFDLNDLFN